MKKGQITIFIIIGLLILFSVFILLHYSGDDDMIEEQASLPKIDSFVQQCVDQTAEDAVLHVSREGGYYENKSISLFYPSSFGNTIPLYLSPDEYHVPDSYLVAQSLESYMEEHLPACTKGFESFRSLGVDVEMQPPEASVSIAMSQIFFQVDYPVRIRQGDSVEEVSSFLTTVNSDLLIFLDSAQKFAEVQKENPEGLAISSLMEISADNNLTFTISSGNNTDLITLSKEDSSGESRNFTFAVGYKKDMLRRRL